MQFPESAPAANPVFFRTYSRKVNGRRESWAEVCDRTVAGMARLGKLSADEIDLLRRMQSEIKSLPSGRWLWVGGTEWLEHPENFYGAYNCSSNRINSPAAIAKQMDLAMQGCGTGSVLEEGAILQLPFVVKEINIIEITPLGTDYLAGERQADTIIYSHADEKTASHTEIIVGDSRGGWAKAYQTLLDMAFGLPPYDDLSDVINVVVDLGCIRPKGERLKGFGGVANPEKIVDLWPRLAKTLNRAVGRKLTPEEVCLIIDEAALVVVAGNVRRSAGMKQFDADSPLLKTSLWTQDESGKWRIDPDKDALRMSNHTRIFHSKPSLEQIRDAVRSQFYSGEGAIQWAGESIARANVDLLDTTEKKADFLNCYQSSKELGRSFLRSLMPQPIDSEELYHRMYRYGLNPCGEIIGNSFMCNLAEVHLNQLDPLDLAAQTEAFWAAGLNAAVLLHHKFPDEPFNYSREIDPIVGISFTGLFDFFVNAFGVEWLKWWEAGRPDEWRRLSEYISARAWDGGGFYSFTWLSEFYRAREQEYLSFWKEVAHKAVWDYCDRHGLKRPNRCTTGQPAGCGSRELLRIFDQGLIYADEVMEDGQGEVEDIPLTVRDGLAAKTGIANQPLNLVRVTLNNGRILRLTPDHRLSVQGEWVCAIELIAGMQLDFNLGEYLSTIECGLNGIDLSTYRKYNPSLQIGEYHNGYITSVNIPERMSPSLAYFIGAMFGNGCSDIRNGTRRIRFSHQDLEVLNKISDVSEKLFGIRGRLTSDTTIDRHELCIASRPIFDWMKLNDLLKPCTSKDLDRIPLAVRCSSSESILAFFCGLIDTDGCVRTNGSTTIESASESFIRNLQQIAEAVGLCFSVGHNTKGENHQATKSMHSLRLSRMVSLEQSIRFLNMNSVKCQRRNINPPKRQFSFNPYAVKSVETESDPDYSFDFAIAGADDDDSWYWQGAIKSHNTKSLLTGASPGFHPPKAAFFIRRITFAANDPVALACLQLGFNVVPGQSDKDGSGNLLDDPFDPRCTEWLVEIPTKTCWADLPGAEDIDISKFSATAQLDFYMQVQKHYIAHNLSGTIELRESEIEAVSQRIHQAIQDDEGYISVALLARFDDTETYPRLPFEPITRDTYEELMKGVTSRRQTDDFQAALSLYDSGHLTEAGPAGCDSDKCLMPEKKPV